ncbi:MAG: hypothetical protein IT425_13575 [Pirellulales bacterium]|nr:hypothetical protein [Pirellulales bacterium]
MSKQPSEQPPSPAQPPQQLPRRDSRVALATAITFIPIVILAGASFGFKFYELVTVALKEPDGVFAVTPIINYLLAGIGFLFMMGWAAKNGMFHDIEQPKRDMLAIEDRLNARSEPFAPWSNEPC